MYSSIDAILKFISECVCANQAGLAQYSFIAAEKHKQLKDFLRDKNLLTEQEPPEHPVDPEVVKEIQSRLQNLEKYLYLGIYRIFSTNYVYLCRFFEQRSPLAVRASMKVIVDNQLVALVREPEFFMEENPIPLEKNVAFRTIADGKKYYLCNDVPEAVVSDSYYNPRIKKEEARKYNQGRVDVVANEHRFDQKWVYCWKDARYYTSENYIYNARPHPQTCYKSTLAVPLSILTEQLEESFMDNFHIVKDAPRAIFGFLCLDHCNAGFFDKKVDVSFAYIIADLLSLYLIEQLAHTQFSSVYYRASKILEQFY